MKNEQRIERQPGAVQFRSWKARTRRLNLVKRYEEVTEALASAAGRELGLVMANRGTREAGLGEPGKLRESKSEQRRRICCKWQRRCGGETGRKYTPSEGSDTADLGD